MNAKVAIAAIVGFLAGAIAIATLSSAGGDDEAADGEPGASTGSPRPATPPATATVAPTDPPAAEASPRPGPPPNTLLVWTSGGLPPGFSDAVARLDVVEQLSVVRAEQIGLVAARSGSGETIEEHPPGWSVPLDALAVDPAAFGHFAPAAAALGRLQPGMAVLTETSAELRQVEVGDVLDLAAGSVEVAGIVTDLDGAGAELIVHQDDAERLGVAQERYLLVAHTDSREAVQARIDDALMTVGVPRPIRFRTPAETTWLRHGDAVLPAAIVKQRFGEFAVRDRPGREVDISPDWIEANIVTADVPVLGPVRCHRAVIEPLRRALAALVDGGLSHLVDADEYHGCFVPRRIGVGLPLSRHSWGIAFDLGDDPRQSFGTPDHAVVDAFRQAGFTWGGTWLVPDAIHFEATNLGV